MEEILCISDACKISHSMKCCFKSIIIIISGFKVAPTVFQSYVLKVNSYKNVHISVSCVVELFVSGNVGEATVKVQLCYKYLGIISSHHYGINS